MTEGVQIALIVGVPATLTAIGGVLLGLLADRRARRADQRSDQKLNHITVLTNSTLTAANKRIDELEAIIRTLTTKDRDMR